MSWKNSLREIKKQETEFYDDIRTGDKGLLIEIQDSNNKPLEVTDYSCKIYRKSDSYVGVYSEEVDRIEGEVSFYSRIPPNNEDYREEDFIEKMKFRFNNRDSFDIQYYVNLRQGSGLVVECKPLGDLILKYEDGKLKFVQCAITYEAAK